MNFCCLSGNVVRKEQFNKTEKGCCITSCLAVSRDFVNKATGKYDADFISLVFYNQSAEYFNEKVNTGDKIEVVGQWRTRTLENENGKKYINECVVNSFKVIIKNTKTEDDKTLEAVEESGNTDPDLPF